MSSATPPSRWLFLLSPRWLAWHAFIVVSAVGMLWLGDWQLHRAETGNALSWAYTFEWPVFAIFGVVFWGKTIFDEWRQPGGAAKQAEALRAAGQTADGDLALPGTLLASNGLPGTGLPGTARAAAETDDEAADDPDLAAYNAYLARLNRQTTPSAQPTLNTQTTREEAGNAP
jgi:hypothetical protein